MDNIGELHEECMKLLENSITYHSNIGCCQELTSVLVFQTYSAFNIFAFFFPSHSECTSDTNVSIVVTTPSDAVNTSSTVLMVCVAHGSPAPSIGWQYRDTTVTNCTSQRVKLLHLSYMY